MLDSNGSKPARFLPVCHFLLAYEARPLPPSERNHGEEFFEHGGLEHGHAFWREVLDVPLVIQGLGTGRIEEPVSLRDVAAQASFYSVERITKPGDDGHAAVG